MPITIVDGKGSGREAAVNKANQLDVHSESLPESSAATIRGDAYNMNTGLVSMTDAVVTPLMYLKNTQDEPYLLTHFAIGAGIVASATAPINVTMIRNPTSVDFSTAMSQNQNRNFGSTKTFTGDVFEGVTDDTVTGGDTIATFFLNANSRLFAGIDFVLTKSDSVCFTIDCNQGSGTVIVYGALIGYYVDD